MKRHCAQILTALAEEGSTQSERMEMVRRELPGSLFRTLRRAKGLSGMKPESSWGL